MSIRIDNVRTLAFLDERYVNISGDTMTGDIQFNAIARFIGPVVETAQNLDRIDIGVQNGTPRMIFEDSGYVVWEIDNSSGTFRWFTPGTVRLTLSLTELTLNTLNLILPSNSLVAKFGVGRDATIGFDGNSFNIIANAVTATDTINIASNIFNVTDTQLLLSGVSTLGAGAIEAKSIDGTGKSPIIIREPDGTGGMSLNADSEFSGFGLGLYSDGTTWRVLTPGVMLVYKSPTQGLTYSAAGLTPGDAFAASNFIISKVDLATGAYGIGSISPDRMFDIARNSQSGTFTKDGIPTLRVLNTATSIHSFSAFEVAGDNDSTRFNLVLDGLGSGGIIGEKGAYLGMATNHPLWLMTSNTKRVEIAAGGAVNILGNLTVVNGLTLIDSANGDDVTHEVSAHGSATGGTIGWTLFDSNEIWIGKWTDHYIGMDQDLRHDAASGATFNSLTITSNAPTKLRKIQLGDTSRAATPGTWIIDSLPPTYGAQAPGNDGADGDGYYMFCQNGQDTVFAGKAGDGGGYNIKLGSKGVGTFGATDGDNDGVFLVGDGGVTDFVQIDRFGHVGIGIVSGSPMLYIQDDHTDQTLQRSVFVDSNPTITQDGSYSSQGLLFDIRPSVASTYKSTGSIQGINGTVVAVGAGDITGIKGITVNAGVNTGSTGTVDDVSCFEARLFARAGTVSVGVYYKGVSPLTEGTLTEGWFIQDLTGLQSEFSGDVWFKGSGSGLLYGEISANDNATVTSVSSAAFTQVLIFDTNGVSNNITPDHTSDHITIVKTGHYMVNVCTTITNQAGAGHKIELIVAKNDGATIFVNLRRHRTLASGTDAGALPICGHVALTAGDTLEVWVTSDSASAKDITIEDITLGLTMVGG